MRADEDDWIGPAWDRARALRREVIGDAQAALDPANVPEDLRPLLPLAASLSTGEEGLDDRFAEVLGDAARSRVVDAVARRRASLDRFVEGAPDAPARMSDEQIALLDLRRIVDAWRSDVGPSPYTRAPARWTAEEIEAATAIAADVLRRIAPK